MREAKEKEKSGASALEEDVLGDKGKTKLERGGIWGTMKMCVERLSDARDVQAGSAVAACVVAAEVVLCACIVWKVPYTEIDWVAYMEEVEGFLEGERDYMKLKGQTGPLVYPAGFVYVFALLRRLTSGGRVFEAQVIFGGIYIVTQMVVLAVYVRARVVPPFALPLLALSRRMHSIYLLRLFNDGVAMLPLYASVLLMQSGRWVWALALFSLAVSVKMNVLLMAPPVFMLMMEGASRTTTAAALATAAGIQLVLGAPFLATYPWSYLSRSFDLGRQFMYKWTVNFRFLPEHIFLSKGLAVSLLALHAALLLLFAHRCWCTGGMPAAFRRGLSRQSTHVALPPAKVAFVVFSGNLVGILCARSLHYQFYSWYFHMVPLLLWATKAHLVAKAAIWVVIEVCWNVYPSTVASSLSLLACHVVLVGALLVAPSAIGSDAAAARVSSPHPESDGAGRARAWLRGAKHKREKAL